MSQTQQIHVPIGINYTCHNSGVCCSVFPKIPVDDETLRFWNETGLAGVADAECNVENVDQAAEQLADEPHLVLRRRADCSCVFFTKDKRCRVHAVHGPSAKPRVCQDFPFRFRATPDGVFVGLSFVCPTVRGNEGLALTEQIGSLAERSERAYSTSAVGDVIKVNDRLELTWQQYRMLEEAYYELLNRGDKPLSQRIIALNVLTNFVDLFYQGTRGKDVPYGQVGRLTDPQLEEFFAALRTNGYTDVLRVASKRVNSPAVRRMFIGMITSFGNTLFAKRSRAAVVGRIVAQYARHAAGVGKVYLNPFEKKIPYRVIREAELPADPASVELIMRYVQHCIFRKDLVYNCTLSRGVNLLLLNCALLPWYAAASAAQVGRSSPQIEDWSAAICEVEKLYGFHSRFYQFFTDYPVMDDIVESFMLRRNYPFLLLSQ